MDRYQDAMEYPNTRLPSPSHTDSLCGCHLCPGNHVQHVPLSEEPYPAVYSDPPQDQCQSSSSQSRMLDGTSGVSRPTVIVPRYPSMLLPATGNLPRHERFLSRLLPPSPINARERRQCSVCSRILATAGSLKVHMRTHTGEKPFQCRYCFKAFSQSGNLTVHERIHTREKPYQCELCGKRFTQSSALKKHQTGFRRDEDISETS